VRKLNFTSMQHVRFGALFLLLLSCMGAWAIPVSRHIYILQEENHSFEEVVGSSQMPYFNSLIGKGALATQYYSDVHSSFPAWQWLVAGAEVSATNVTGCFSHDNIVRSILPAGLRWKSYNEELPSAGWLGAANLDYRRGHNPLTNWTDTCASSQRYNSVPFGNFWTDVKGSMANLVFLNPDLMHDGHSASLWAADLWMKPVVQAILARPEFRPGGDGQLWIVWDEGNMTWDYRCGGGRSGCGGRVAVLLLGPQARVGYRSTMLAHQQNLLRTLILSMRLSLFPGASKSPTISIWDLFR